MYGLGGDTDFDTAYGQKDEKDINGVNNENETSASFMKGMLIWMMFNRGCYFWMKAIFQIISFSFFIITLIILTHFDTGYWQVAMWVLLLKHIFDFTAYNIDLIGFSCRNLSSLKYKMAFDLLSLAAGIVVCIYFFRSMLNSVNSSYIGTNGYHEFTVIKNWVAIEVSVFFTSLMI